MRHKHPPFGAEKFQRLSIAERKWLRDWYDYIYSSKTETPVPLLVFIRADKIHYTLSYIHHRYKEGTSRSNGVAEDILMRFYWKPRNITKGTQPTMVAPP